MLNVRMVFCDLWLRYSWTFMEQLGEVILWMIYSNLCQVDSIWLFHPCVWLFCTSIAYQSHVLTRLSVRRDAISYNTMSYQPCTRVKLWLSYLSMTSSLVTFGFCSSSIYGDDLRRIGMPTVWLSLNRWGRYEESLIWGEIHFALVLLC